MWEGLKRRRKINNLREGIKRTQKAFAEDLAAARAKKATRVEIHGIESQEQFEVEMLDDEIDYLETDFLRREANRLGLPMPQHDDETAWRESYSSGQRILTTKAIAELRSAIRKERKERWDYWAGRVLFVIAVVSAVGAAIAYFVKWGK